MVSDGHVQFSLLHVNITIRGTEGHIMTKKVKRNISDNF